MNADKTHKVIKQNDTYKAWKKLQCWNSSSILYAIKALAVFGRISSDSCNA